LNFSPSYIKHLYHTLTSRATGTEIFGELKVCESFGNLIPILTYYRSR
jgi:hypothetical protein